MDVDQDHGHVITTQPLRPHGILGDELVKEISAGERQRARPTSFCTFGFKIC
eukprot:CAMPEP_0172936680 /NCGR_PEP_ID=MMETSP1075-20121228/222141_1 /TAXON_ID=2916 /ORGANISM="Ceratium fusus, Strain PA161109" /LENGTH=51 /DNA_ID=CAMNT_0013798053 /DNA_START=177 /DNA_END=332 /DNA_ORIENTATION=+